jgi:ribosome-binding factor A
MPRKSFKRNFNRIDRIDSLVQQTLAEIISRELDFSSLGLVTITNVKISKDLSTAKIYIICHPEAQTEKALLVLKQAAKSLRFWLAQEIELRKMPELHFYYDDVLSQGIRISNLLNSVK